MPWNLRMTPFSSRKWVVFSWSAWAIEPRRWLLEALMRSFSDIASSPAVQPQTLHMGEPPSPTHRPVRDPEESVDHHADQQDDEHRRQQSLGVRKVASELQPDTDRRLVADDDQQLAGHQLRQAKAQACFSPP